MSYQDDVHQALLVRNFIVERLRAELVGPDPGLLAVQSGIDSVRGEEILREEDPPRVRYAAGVLFPRQVQVDEQQGAGDMAASIEGAPEADDIEVVQPPEAELRYRTGPAVEADTEQEINRSNEYLPSAMGLTALVRLPDRLRMVIRAARYEPFELEGRGRTDRSGQTHSYMGWRRIPICTELELDRSELSGVGNQVATRDVPTGSERVRLKIHVLSRPIVGDSEVRMITFTLLNETDAGGRRPGNEDCLFQCGFEVFDPAGSACFLEYPRRVEELHIHGEVDSRLMEQIRREQASLRLLYRKRRVFAVGHGCAPEWAASTGGGTTRIRTETVPVFEIPPIKPAQLPELDLRMRSLAADGLGAVRVVDRLCDLYEDWIRELRGVVERTNEIPEDLVPAARTHIAEAERCLRRMRDGVELLRGNQLVRKAFSLMNRAMLMQQIHYRISSQSPRDWVRSDAQLVLAEPFQPPDYSTAENSWYPFQLAFILMNIRSIVDPKSRDREVVDVIWFPTGGGKTEAYLGLAALTILYRRLRNPHAEGTAVLTRYTLRLLTTQQYQRAASLVCALEVLRRSDEACLGTAPITIGLWVGSGVTPNREDEAVAEFQRMLREGGRNNPFVLLSCPWCGARMGVFEAGRNNYQARGYRQLANPRRIRHVCDDPACEFSDDRGLPVLVVDEAIYRNPPTLLVGTVDKFAMLPWNADASALFGLGSNNSNPPPELIIQDELHLIAGPSGPWWGSTRAP